MGETDLCMSLYDLFCNQIIVYLHEERKLNDWLNNLSRNNYGYCMVKGNAISPKRWLIEGIVHHVALEETLILGSGFWCLTLMHHFFLAGGAKYIRPFMPEALSLLTTTVRVSMNPAVHSKGSKMICWCHMNNNVLNHVLICI